MVFLRRLADFIWFFWGDLLILYGFFEETCWFYMIFLRRLVDFIWFVWGGCWFYMVWDFFRWCFYDLLMVLSGLLVALWFSASSGSSKGLGAQWFGKNVQKSKEFSHRLLGHRSTYAKTRWFRWCCLKAFDSFSSWLPPVFGRFFLHGSWFLVPSPFFRRNYVPFFIFFETTSIFPALLKAFFRPSAPSARLFARLGLCLQTCDDVLSCLCDRSTIARGWGNAKNVLR